MKYCSNCGKELKENADVCLNCGSYVKQTKTITRKKRCKKCNEEFDYHLTRCPKCNKKYGFPIWGIILIVLSIMFIFIGLPIILFFSYINIDETINKYENIIEEKIEEAYKNRKVNFIVSIKDISNEFIDNQFKADTKYEDMIIQTEGIISEMNSDYNNQKYIVIKDPNDNSYQMTCYFETKNQISEIADYQIGDKVKIAGEFDYYYNQLYLDECIVKN